jgi:hypothetical protein
MKYIEYTGSTVKQCLDATTEIFQDGYIHCPILDYIGCVECEKRFGDGSNWEFDESQNYVRKPGWFEEVKEMPKQKYWTKCGRQFEKNSTASVTGYTIDLKEDLTPLGELKVAEFNKCIECPFRVEVTEGWPPVFKRWECRAGSKEPNHTNDWVGSIEDKNTISINSLDNNFLESIIEYCKDHLDVSAGYNADHLEDCRRTLSISCSSNKKGIAAKKALIEKFFPATEDMLKIHNAITNNQKQEEPAPETGKQTIDKLWAIFVKCEACSHFICDGSNMNGYGICDYKNRRMAKNHEACANYVPVNENFEGDTLFNEQKCRVCGCTDNNACEGGCSWVEDDLCSKCAKNSCDETGCPFNNGNGSCCFKDESLDSDGYHRNVIGAVDGYECKNEDVLLAYKIITDPDSCDIPAYCSECKNWGSGLERKNNEFSLARCSVNDSIYNRHDKSCEHFNPIDLITGDDEPCETEESQTIAGSGSSICAKCENEGAGCTPNEPGETCPHYLDKIILNSLESGPGTTDVDKPTATTADAVLQNSVELKDSNETNIKEIDSNEYYVYRGLV